MRALPSGLLLWLVGTIGIRLFGQHVLRPDRPFVTIAVYGISFIAMAIVVPRLVHRDRAAVTLLMLPTLVLDALACVFFTSVYPNLAPAAAGLFGGWMLICCGGAAAGVWLKR